MNSAHAANSEPGPTATGDMRRLRRRGRIATGIGSAGYIITFIIDIVRDTPSDDSIVGGVERACGFIAVAGFLVSFLLWVMTSNVEYARTIWNLRERAERRRDGSTASTAPINGRQIQTGQRTNPARDHVV